jgi:hypothetical protein
VEFRLSANGSAIVLGSLNVMATIMSTFTVDKAGRRVLLIISAISMFVFLALLSIFFFVTEYKVVDPKVLGWVPIVTLSGYVSFIDATTVCLKKTHHLQFFKYLTKEKRNLPEIFTVL